MVQENVQNGKKNRKQGYFLPISFLSFRRYSADKLDFDFDFVKMVVVVVWKDRLRPSFDHLSCQFKIKKGPRYERAKQRSLFSDKIWVVTLIPGKGHGRLRSG